MKTEKIDYSIRFIKALTLIVFFIISGIALASLQKIQIPDSTPLIVEFGDSTEEKAAVSEIRTLLPHTKIVKFSSNTMSEALRFAIGPVIFVGHGSSEGIMTTNGLISWKEMSSIFSFSKSNQQFILSCDSEYGVEIAKKQGINMIGIPGKVDAIIGADVVSFAILRGYRLEENANIALARLKERAFTLNSVNFMPLSYVPYLNQMGWVEAAVDLANVVLLTVSFWAALTAVYLSTKVGTAFAAYVYTASGSGLLRALLDIVVGVIMGDAGLVGTGIVAAFLPLFGFFLYLITNYISDILERLTALGLLTTDQAAFAASIATGILLAIKVGILVALLIVSLITLNKINTDQWDCDDVPLSSQSCGGGGGGGCVSKNTKVLLSDGIHVKNVQSLHIGDNVLGYNISSGQTLSVTVTNITVARVSTLLEINDGLLSVTLTKQPIYMRNTTFTGWLYDPEDLRIGYEIFNPISGEWMIITNLGLTFGNFKVYDVTTNPLNTFIGNGFLLDAPLKV